MTRLQVRMPGHDRNLSLGHLGAAWIEHFYRHGDGDIHGQKMTLDQDFYDALVDMYAQGEDARRLYRAVVLSRAKGTAKSELAGGVVLFDAHGPSRCDGFAKGGEVFEQYDFRYVYQPGEPLGKFITDPFTRILATEEKQTGNTFSNILVNLEDQESPLYQALDGRRDFFAGNTMIRLPRGAKITPATSGAASKDGGKETNVVADEAHLYNDPELRRMYDTVFRNMFKRKIAQPWIFVTTTMYQDGQDSIGERLHKKALAIQEGKARNTGLLFDHLEGPAITDLSDEKEVRAALLVAYDNRPWPDYDGMVTMPQDPMISPEDFRRYQLNQQGGGKDAYVTSVEIAAAQQIDGESVPPLKRGDPITLGFDYAPGNRSNQDPDKKKRRLRVPDATALVACRLTDMTLHPLGIWEADESVALRDGWNPPWVDIEATVHDAFKAYDVFGMFADPTGIESYLNNWTARYLKKLRVKATAEKPMYRYMSGKSASRSGKDVDALYEAIASEQVHMVEDMRLTRHFLNARRRVGQFGTAIFKENPDSANKIDAAVASVLAYSAAVAALNKGLGIKKKSTGRAKRLY